MYFVSKDVTCGSVSCHHTLSSALRERVELNFKDQLLQDVSFLCEVRLFHVT